MSAALAPLMIADRGDSISSTGPLTPKLDSEGFHDPMGLGELPGDLKSKFSGLEFGPPLPDSPRSDGFPKSYEQEDLYQDDLPFKAVLIPENAPRVPNSPNARAVWFLKQVTQSFYDPKGAYIGKELFFPNTIWNLPVLPLRVVNNLIERADTIAYVASVRLQGLNSDNFQNLTRAVDKAYRSPLSASANPPSLGAFSETSPASRTIADSQAKSLTRIVSSGSSSISDSLAKKSKSSFLKFGRSSSSKKSKVVPQISAPMDTRISPHHVANVKSTVKTGASRPLSRTMSISSGSSDVNSVFSGKTSIYTSNTTSSFHAQRYPYIDENPVPAEEALRKYALAIEQLARGVEEEGYNLDTAGRYVMFVLDQLADNIVEDIFSLHKLYMKGLISLLLP